MPELNYVIPKVNLPIIFLVERMPEKSEEIVNAIREFTADFEKVNADFNAQFHFYKFSNNNVEKALDFDLSKIEESNFFYEDIEKIKESNIDVDRLFEGLCNDMNQEGLFKDKLPHKRPIVIMIADGEKRYVCSEDFIEKLKENKWFEISYKIVITVKHISEDLASLLKEVNFESIILDEYANLTQIFADNFNIVHSIVVEEFVQNQTGSIPCGPENFILSTPCFGDGEDIVKVDPVTEETDDSFMGDIGEWG